MQTPIHPEYGPVVFRDKSAGTAFLSQSTLVTRGLPTLTGARGDAPAPTPPPPRPGTPSSTARRGRGLGHR